MKDSNKKAGFKTDIYSGALEINEEMNRKDKTKRKAPKPAADQKKVPFTTDAFSEALKINDEMNERADHQETDNVSE